MTGKSITIAMMIVALKALHQTAPDILIIDEVHMKPPEPEYIDFPRPVCWPQQPLKHLRPFKEKRKRK